MTLTPDRQGGKREGTPRAQSGSGASAEFGDRTDKAGKAGKKAPSAPAAAELPTFRQLLAEAGLDLSDHPLADKFDMVAEEAADDGEVRPRVNPGEADAIVEPSWTVEAPTVVPSSNTVEKSTSEGSVVVPDADGRRGDVSADVGTTGSPGEADTGGGSAVPHPLLTDEAWRDLDRFAPELTAGIAGFVALKDGLKTFDRPMGPEEAVLVMDGIETASRVLEAMNAVALSVFERCGTPTNFGAKSTKALVQNRLQLTGQEASRRTELAKNLGNRVDMSGQSMSPLCPLVSDGFHDGSLSSGQAAVINECMQKLPSWVSAEVRARTEQRLVDHAPEVRVSDLRVIFKRILDEIDPDGEEPKDPSDRSMYRVNLRVRTNGDWDLSGLLDPVSGGVLNGLLTSRIQSADPVAADTSVGGTESGGIVAGGAVPGGSVTSANGGPVVARQDASASHEMIELFTEVLSGDRHDARVPYPAGFAEVDGTVGGDGNAKDDGKALVGPIGVGTDGVAIDLSAEQPTVRNRIYERFASLVSKIDMTRTVTGAPYALVVTAKAEDLVERLGEGKSGTEDPVPIRELSGTGLNGAVFFHLMSGKAKTVQVVTEKRFANAKQLAVLTARDQGCTFPGCDTPPGWCDVHHIVPWSEGGRTDVNNMTLACGAHHHLIDRSDWYAVMLRDGRPAWVPPVVVDPARKPLLHARFIATEIIDALFDDSPEDDSPEDDSPDDDSGDNDGT